MVVGELFNFDRQVNSSRMLNVLNCRPFCQSVKQDAVRHRDDLGVALSGVGSSVDRVFAAW